MFGHCLNDGQENELPTVWLVRIEFWSNRNTQEYFILLRYSYGYDENQRDLIRYIYKYLSRDTGNLCMMSWWPRIDWNVVDTITKSPPVFRVHWNRLKGQQAVPLIAHSKQANDGVPA